MRVTSRDELIFQATDLRCIVGLRQVDAAILQALQEVLVLIAALRARGNVVDLVPHGSRLFVPVAPLRSGPGRFTTERRHDLWIDKGYCDTDSLTLHLPEGYVVEALPKSVTIENRFGKIAFEALCSGDRLHIRIRLLRRSGRYPQSEYAAFREFMQAVDRVYSAKIVLRKV